MVGFGVKGKSSREIGTGFTMHGAAARINNIITRLRAEANV